MGNVESRLPTEVKRGLENACSKASQKLVRLTPGKKPKRWVAEKLSQQVCKDVDQSILKLAAKELAKLAKSHSAKPPAHLPARIKGVPTMKQPGHGMPSLTIPLPSVDLGDGTTGNFKLKVWGDPKDLQKEKGGMVNFTVEF